MNSATLLSWLARLASTFAASASVARFEPASTSSGRSPLTGSTVGVASLPVDAAVEVEGLFEVS